MIIGVPKEIKANENRVALQPSGAEILTHHGHVVYVQKSAGVGSGFTDEMYEKAGAKILDTAKEVFEKAEMIMKVKEPLAPEIEMIKEGQILFTYFHFAASRELTEGIMKTKSIAIAYETIEKEDGSLPLLNPMSEVAGRLAIQAGARCLEKTFGGEGLLLGGVTGVAPAKVVIIGGGIVGTNAAQMAAGLGANVVVLDINIDRLRFLDHVLPANVTTLMSSPETIRQQIADADLVVGAVLIPGAKAPHLITRDMLKLMKKGSVIVDVAVDQGGCVETIHPTTHAEPTYEVDGVIHYGVANMPGAVPRTSTVALTNVTLPYAVEIANKGYRDAIKSNKEIALGVNVIEGKVTYEPVAEAFGMDYTDLADLMK
ncbi:alanine dehydrogenase [candidate division KSB1 bacterium 4484_87]|nr:MAG: alanine dehydrogenase [candidate division KSB1 bacterium 4484_87]